MDAQVHVCQSCFVSGLMVCIFDSCTMLRGPFLDEVMTVTCTKIGSFLDEVTLKICTKIVSLLDEVMRVPCTKMRS